MTYDQTDNLLEYITYLAFCNNQNYIKFNYIYIYKLYHNLFIHLIIIFKFFEINNFNNQNKLGLPIDFFF